MSKRPARRIDNRNTPAIMAVLLALGASPSGAATPADTIPRNAYEGWKQYQVHCARCHGEFGVGSTFAPSLVASLRSGSSVPDETTFTRTVCDGRVEKGMPAFCQLGTAIGNMYAYLKLRADGKVRAVRPVPAAS